MLIEQKDFRFKCRRCATLCCKLGGPPLTSKDIKRIERLGYTTKKILETTNSGTEDSVNSCRLKTRDDGSCIFLQQDINVNIFHCSIYDYRPTICKRYPFNFEYLDHDRIVLKFIPCCRGLNNEAGDTLNEDFIADNLLESLLEFMEHSQKKGNRPES